VSGSSTIVRVELIGGLSVQLVSPASQSMSSPETFPPPDASPVTVTSSVFVPGSGVWSKLASTSMSLPLKLIVHLLSLELLQGLPIHVSNVQAPASFAVRTTDPLAEEVE
jgi:hypothetical protein